MIIPTHRLIGKYIYNSVLINTGIKLEKNELLFGSILPDISKKYICQKHFFSISYNYILNMIEDLYNKAPNITSKEFSVRLGVILHYISDFFCTPHNDRDYYKNHIKEHILFESKLHYIFKKNLQAKEIELPKLDEFSYASIKTLIDSLHFSYEERGLCLENDYYSTLHAVAILANLITIASLENTKHMVFVA